MQTALKCAHIASQEALHCVHKRQEDADMAIGVYMGIMYTEYLDAILAPQVCTKPLLGISQTGLLLLFFWFMQS
jgi:hypothetical protein